MEHLHIFSSHAYGAATSPSTPAGSQDNWSSGRESHAYSPVSPSGPTEARRAIEYTIAPRARNDIQPAHRSPKRTRISESQQSTERHEQLRHSSFYGLLRRFANTLSSLRPRQALSPPVSLRNDDAAERPWRQGPTQASGVRRGRALATQPGVDELAILPPQYQWHWYDEFEASLIEAEESGAFGEDLVSVLRSYRDHMPSQYWDWLLSQRDNLLSDSSREPNVNAEELAEALQSLELPDYIAEDGLPTYLEAMEPYAHQRNELDRFIEGHCRQLQQNAIRARDLRAYATSQHAQTRSGGAEDFAMVWYQPMVRQAQHRLEAAEHRNQRRDEREDEVRIGKVHPCLR